MPNSIFHGKFLKNIDFSGKNWLFTAISGQIILFLFKSHHLRIYFLYMIRYNNILRPVHDPTTPPRPPCQKSGGSRPPNPPGLTPMPYKTSWLALKSCLEALGIRGRPKPIYAHSAVAVNRSKLKFKLRP